MSPAGGEAGGAGPGLCGAAGAPAGGTPPALTRRVLDPARHFHLRVSVPPLNDRGWTSSSPGPSSKAGGEPRPPGAVRELGGGRGGPQAGARELPWRPCGPKGPRRAALQPSRRKGYGGDVAAGDSKAG